MVEHYGQFIKGRMVACAEKWKKMARGTLLTRSIYDDFKGCTNDEIEELKKLQGVDFLPRIYNEFLSVMGHKSGNMLFRSQCAYYKCLKEVKQDSQQLVAADNPSLKIPNDAFVFFNDQGISFLYFLTSDRQENPQIFQYYEASDHFEPLEKRLSEWFDENIQALEDSLDDLLNRRAEN